MDDNWVHMYWADFLPLSTVERSGVKADCRLRIPPPPPTIIYSAWINTVFVTLPRISSKPGCDNFVLPLTAAGRWHFGFYFLSGVLFLF